MSIISTLLTPQPQSFSTKNVQVSFYSWDSGLGCVLGEKRSALLAEVARLREERSSESAELAGEEREYISQQPCRGTVNITNIQLPLKVEFVCSSHNRTGRATSTVVFLIVLYIYIRFLM